ncbi:MAG: hypothetical protein EZS28_024846, partial [Streblomastix strix]
MTIASLQEDISLIDRIKLVQKGQFASDEEEDENLKNILQIIVNEFINKNSISVQNVSILSVLGKLETIQQIAHVAQKEGRKYNGDFMIFGQ